MTAFSRWTIAIFCLLSAAGIVIVASSPDFDPGQRKAFFVFGAFLVLIAVVCFPGRGRTIAARLLGTMVFVGCLSYIVSERGNPLTALQHYHRSGTNLINALIAFVLFGLPGGYIALTGKFPLWTVLGDKMHNSNR